MYLLPSLFVIAFALFALPVSSIDRSRVNNSSEIARCYGNSPCNACSNCSGCKYCSAGGTCGVCAPPPSKKKPAATRQGVSSGGTQKQTPAASSQCKAKTKKGTRCSRNATSGGYCWQHGK